MTTRFDVGARVIATITREMIESDEWDGCEVVTKGRHPGTITRRAEECDPGDGPFDEPRSRGLAWEVEFDAIRWPSGQFVKMVLFEDEMEVV